MRYVLVTNLYVIAAAVLLPAAASRAQTTYFVNRYCGNDAWTGERPACDFPDGPKKSIQAAIDAAASGDTVVIGSGQYFGEGNTDLNFNGKSIRLRSAAGAERCIIVGEGSDLGGMTFNSGEGPDAIVEGLTFQLCLSPAGGGIRIEAGSNPTIRDCVFDTCVAVDGGLRGGGGAISIGPGAAATIERCRFVDNIARQSRLGGAAILCDGGFLAMVDCDVYGNEVVSHGGRGGGLTLVGAGSAEVRRTTISANQVRVPSLTGDSSDGNSGGGVFVGEDSIARFEDCTLSFNYVGAEHTSASGGGAYVEQGSDVSFVRCAFIRNRLSGGQQDMRGAAVRNVGATLTMIDCALVGNKHSLFDSGSGGVSSSDGVVRLINSTLVGNVSESKYGGAIESSGSDQMVVVNCILWANSSPTITGGAVVEFSCVEGGWPGEGNIDADPLLLQTAPDDYRLQPGSPCIDAGDSEMLDCIRGGSTDRARAPRYRDDKSAPDTGRGRGAIIDMGAHESPGAAGLRLACVAPLIAGRTSEVTLEQGRAGATAVVVYGFADGETDVPGCPPQQFAIRHARLLGRAEANEAGRATLEVFIPKSAAGRTVWIQAVEPYSCRVSNLTVVSVGE